MSDSFIVKRKNGSRELRWMVAVVLAIFLFVFVLYSTKPFSPFLNDLFSNLALVGTAAMCAVFATLVVLRYETSEPPRTVWLYFALGLWLWTIAEVIWAVYNMLQGEVDFTLADLFWVLGYGPFAFAIYAQYVIILRPNTRERLNWILAWGGSTILLIILTTWVLLSFTGEKLTLPAFVNCFYPAADLMIGLAALWILRRFRNGALGYPWLGLLIFAIADALYAILEFTGFYTWSVSSGNLWSMITDLAYNAAYLFVALGCFVQLLLLKYGPIFITARKEVKK